MLCRRISLPVVGGANGPDAGSRLDAQPTAGCSTVDADLVAPRTSVGRPSVGGTVVGQRSPCWPQGPGYGPVSKLRSVLGRERKGSDARCRGAVRTAAAAEAAPGTGSLAVLSAVTFTTSTTSTRAQAARPGNPDSSLPTALRAAVMGVAHALFLCRSGPWQDGSRPSLSLGIGAGWGAGGARSAEKVVQEASGAAELRRRAGGNGFRTGSNRAPLAHGLTTRSWWPAVPGAAFGTSSACR
jgi:hypothetical protein